MYIHIVFSECVTKDWMRNYVSCYMQKLQKNYDALLQMYGEKAEEAEELKLDLLDVKAMYRSQVMCCMCFIVC